MSMEFLAVRERALENQFFYRVAQKLLQQWQEHMRAEKDCRQLATETGIKNEAVIAELVELRIAAETLLALSLVPLVQVAWADRIVEATERAAVLKAAEGVTSLRNDVISHARKVAAVTGGILGIGLVSQQEEAVRDELGRAFVGGTTE